VSLVGKFGAFYWKQMTRIIFTMTVKYDELFTRYIE